MEKYKFYIDKNKSRWSLKDINDNSIYMGWNDPYRDAVYATILDSALGTEASTELKGAFAGLGFTGHSLMLRADESSCTPIKGEFTVQ